ncbi:MAG TPA: phosphatase PAP2 family protein, partial [Solirubrobacteraceae bacterium]|nr:phosphatase PAP2 family protein [Solirubrobacteraceae bacterium]
MRRSLPALLVAALCAVAAAVVWLVATRTGWGAAIDGRTLGGFAGLETPRVKRAAESVSALVDPPGFAALAALIVGVAVVRGRLGLAGVVAVVMLAANVTTQALKRGLPDVHSEIALGPGPGAWPSGHTTAAMVLALCAVLVAPARLRPFVAAAGGAFAIVVVYSILVLQHHYPSDIVGGYLVAGAWTALGVAVLNAPAVRARAAVPG